MSAPVSLAGLRAAARSAAREAATLRSALCDVSDRAYVLAFLVAGEARARADALRAALASIRRARAVVEVRAAAAHLGETAEDLAEALAREGREEALVVLLAGDAGDPAWVVALRELTGDGVSSPSRRLGARLLEGLEEGGVVVYPETSREEVGGPVDRDGRGRKRRLRGHRRFGRLGFDRQD